MTADDLPQTFTLVLLHYRERTEVGCTVVRRSGREVGVRYTSGFNTYATPTRPMPVQAGKRR